MLSYLFKSPAKIAASYLQKGDELLQSHDYKKAISNYKFSLYFSSSAEAHLRIAKAYKEQDMLIEALGESGNAAKIDEENGEIHNFMGDCFYALGLNESAFESYSKAISCIKNDKRCYSYYMSGKLLKEAGIWCMAMQNYEKALELEPAMTEAKKGLEDINFYMN